MKLVDEVLISLGIVEGEDQREKLFQKFLNKLKKSNTFQIKGNSPVPWIISDDSPEYKIIIKAIDTRIKRGSLWH